jgi:hypothetical protein
MNSIFLTENMSTLRQFGFLAVVSNCAQRMGPLSSRSILQQTLADRKRASQT